MSSVNRGTRALLAAAVVVGGSLLAQIPNVGSSSEKPPAPAAAPATPAPTNKLAGAGEKDKLEIVAPDAAPRAAIFRRAVPGKMVIADLPLVVRVPKTAKGNLDASLLATSDGATETLKLGPPATLPKGHAALYLESRTHVQAKPGDAVLPLRLAIPPGASPDLADGQLTVKTKSRDPATVTVDGTVADAAVAPNPVKMRVTRWWGPLSVFHRFRNDDLSGRE